MADRMFRQYGAPDLVDWLLGLNGEKGKSSVPFEVLPTPFDTWRSTQADDWRCYPPWAQRAARTVDGAAQTAAFLALLTESFEDSEKAGTRAWLNDILRLRQPAERADVVDSLKMLCGVLDQTLKPTTAGFITEMFEAEHLPAAAVWRAMEHTARTEGGRIKPATFADMLDAARARKMNYMALLHPAVTAADHFDKAWHLCQAEAMPAYLAELGQRPTNAPGSGPDHPLWPALKNRMTPREFTAIFGKVKVEDANGWTLIITPSAFMADLLRQKYFEPLEDTFGRFEVRAAA